MNLNDELAALTTAFFPQFSFYKFIEIIASSQDPAKLIIELEKTESIFHLLLINYDLIDNKDDLTEFFRAYSNHINPNIKDINNETALHIVAKNNLFNLAELLLSDTTFFEQPDLHALNERGKTPADLAISEAKEYFNRAMEKDFIERIVLVHALSTESIVNYLLSSSQIDMIDYANSQQSVINAVTMLDDIITKDGIIGNHLNFAETTYSSSFVDRPHTHWSWNHLCHANSGGNWESSAIAILEPLESFSYVEGAAPYDTTIMGPHRLSEKSIILVPHDAVEGVKDRLQRNGRFLGQVKGYDSELTLREAINVELIVSFPKAAKLLNFKGEDISELTISSSTNNRAIGYNFKMGYFEDLYIQIEGKIQLLMQGETNILHPVYADYGRGRHVGLHHGSTSDIEKHPVFIKLKELTESPSLIPNNKDYLIGKEGNKYTPFLCALKAFQVYQALRFSKEETGAHKFADYLLKKAIIAEFRLYHHQHSPGQPALTPEQLKRMVEHDFENLVQALGEIFAFNPDLEKYRRILQRAYSHGLTLPKPYQTASSFTIWSNNPNLREDLLLDSAQGNHTRNEEIEASGLNSFTMQ